MKIEKDSGIQAVKHSRHKDGKRKKTPPHDIMGRGGVLHGNNTGKRKPTPCVRSPVPSALTGLIDSYISEKTGKETSDPVFLSRLKQAVMAQKASYWHEKPGKTVKYGKGYDIFSYLAYQLPVYYTQFRSIAQGLKNENLLPDNLILLDIGTGPGVVPLALIDLWKGRLNQSLEIFSIERSEEHREAFRTLVSGYAGQDTAITVHDPVAGDLVQISEDGHRDLPKKATLISFQNVLAELEHLSVLKRASIVLSYAKLLDDTGCLMIVEPAELRHSTSLRALQRELMKGGLHVYAPCSYLWGSGCSPSSCWSFQEEMPIPPTPLMSLMAGEDEGYRFLNTDIKYSYLILTKKPVSRCMYRIPHRTRMVRLSHLDRYNRRITDVTAAIMSGDIGKRGMHIFKICDGTCREPVYAVLSERNRRQGHSALFTASYGQVLVFSGVQVRKHQVHDAFNIVIGPDSHIEKIIATDSAPDQDPDASVPVPGFQVTGLPPDTPHKKTGYPHNFVKTNNPENSINNAQKMKRIRNRKGSSQKGVK